MVYVLVIICLLYYCTVSIYGYNSPTTVSQVPWINCDLRVISDLFVQIRANLERFCILFGALCSFVYQFNSLRKLYSSVLWLSFYRLHQ